MTSVGTLHHAVVGPRTMRQPGGYGIAKSDPPSEVVPARTGRAAGCWLSNFSPRRSSPNALPMADSCNPTNIGEGPQVGAHYRSIGGSGGRGDQEIVITTRAALLADSGTSCVSADMVTFRFAATRSGKRLLNLKTRVTGSR